MQDTRQKLFRIQKHTKGLPRTTDKRLYDLELRRTRRAVRGRHNRDNASGQDSTEGGRTMLPIIIDLILGQRRLVNRTEAGIADLIRNRTNSTTRTRTGNPGSRTGTSDRRRGILTNTTDNDGSNTSRRGNTSDLTRRIANVIHALNNKINQRSITLNGKISSTLKDLRLVNVRGPDSCNTRGTTRRVNGRRKSTTTPQRRTCSTLNGRRDQIRTRNTTGSGRTSQSTGEPDNSNGRVTKTLVLNTLRRNVTIRTRTGSSRRNHYTRFTRRFNGRGALSFLSIVGSSFEPHTDTRQRRHPNRQR